MKNRFQKTWLFLLLALVAVSICGCTMKYTNLEVPQTAKVELPQGIDTSKLSSLTITQTINVRDSAVKTSTSQDAQGELTIPVAQQGGVANADSTVSEVEAQQDNRDNRTDYDKPVNNRTDTDATNNNTGASVDEESATETDLKGYEVETHDLKHMHGDSSKKLFRWLDHTGSYYGKDIIVKFSDGETWVVKDPEYAQGLDGNIENTNQAYWFSGDLLKSGSKVQQKDRSGVLASVFPDPSSNADKVFIYYKKQ